MFNWEFKVGNFIHWIPCSKSKYKAYLELKELYPNTKIYFLGKYTWDKDKYEAITKRYIELVNKENWILQQWRLYYRKSPTKLMYRQIVITSKEISQVKMSTYLKYNQW
jgi:hypothetical protein